VADGAPRDDATPAAGRRRGRAAAAVAGRLLVAGGALRPGRRRGRAPEEQRARAVVFVSGLSGDTARYRCVHQGEAFAIAGGTFDVRLRRSTELAGLLDRYGCFVLHRVPWDEAVRELVEGARARGKRVIFDADDLVFEPGVREHLQLDRLGADGRRLLEAELEGCRQTLEAADAAIATTDFLAARAREVNGRVAVSYNVVSEEMVEQADAALRRRGPRGARTPVTIAYLSGTPTHERDFLEAADGVLWALESYPETRFRAVGPVELDGRFDRFAGRVERLPRRPWQELPDLLAATDVNLAPLEPDNPFTEAKSCIKYLEAGLLGVPTVASPRSDFARAIDDGVNGLLAEGAEGWRDALRRLIESPGLRAALGRAAHEDVRRNHTTSGRSRPFFETLADVAGPARGPLSINWVAGAAAGTGAATADALAASGNAVEVVGDGPLPPADVSVATSGPTALSVAAHGESLFKCLYVETVEAAPPAAYALPLRHVCAGAELAARLSRLTGRRADWADDERDLDECLRRMCFLRLA
jgi:glycosyltransferase involved in cell wall biosynthesis